MSFEHYLSSEPARGVQVPRRQFLHLGFIIPSQILRTFGKPLHSLLMRILMVFPE
jgi:hypothetical protein